MIPDLAIEHYQKQQSIAAETVREVRALWAAMGEDFDLSWSRIALEVGDTIMAGQLAAAVTGRDSLTAELDDLGLEQPSSDVDPYAFAGWTGDGVELDSATRTSVITAKNAVALGSTAAEALTAGGAWLERFAASEVTAANVGQRSASVAVTPKTGFVRMLNLPSCRDCIILAGRWYRWNEGFERHPGCDCRHIPARESMSELRTDPYDAFDSLTPAEQDRIFGKNDAHAIREGADIYRVVNIRNRGLSSPASKQAQRYGTPTRMTVDDVLDGQRSRAEVLALLEREGYILPAGQVPGGSIRGNDGLSEFGGLMAGQMGRGGTRRGATLSYRETIRTGNRDQLNPATQTAAERRLHLAYLNWEAARAGRNPFSTSGRVPLDPDTKERLRLDLEAQVRNLKNQPDQVRDLARLLGLI